MGFEKIEFDINGKRYKYDKNAAEYNANKTELKYKFNLKEGENKIIILAVSTEQTYAVYKGKCNYIMPQ